MISLCVSVSLQPVVDSDAFELEGVCQLAGLRDLTVWEAGKGLLMKLTQLHQLTSLRYNGPLHGDDDCIGWAEVRNAGGYGMSQEHVDRASFCMDGCARVMCFSHAVWLVAGARRCLLVPAPLAAC
jgi:hypothetical protein